MRGKAWVFGDDIDTDLLAPGRHMRLPVSDLARHCLEGLNQRFASEVRPGDVVVAGRNFGLGSSREQAAEVLKYLGVAAVVAESFGGIFRRNAFNLGLPALICAEATSIKANDSLSIDIEAALIENATQKRVLPFSPLQEPLLTIVAHGGLMPYLAARIAAQGGASTCRK